MDDFERRVREMLAERAGATTVPDDLAAAARSRYRRRRVAKVVAAGASVAVVVAAVPFALGALRVHRVVGPVGQPAPDVAGVPADWRWESYGGVEFAVPPDWGHGALDQWCVGPSDAPRVQRPDAASTLVLCTPYYGYGVLVTGPGDSAPSIADAGSFPAGASVRRTEVDGITLTIVAADAETADTIKSFAADYPGTVDHYGCESTVDVPALGEMPSTTGGNFDRSVPISICRYGVGVKRANLTGSEQLSEDQTRAWWSVVDAMQPGRGPDPKAGSCLASPESEAVVVRSGGRDVVWAHFSGCTEHGADLAGKPFRLDADLMKWVLSPGWSGGLGGEIPIPDRLRH